MKLQTLLSRPSEAVSEVTEDVVYEIEASIVPPKGEDYFKRQIRIDGWNDGLKFALAVLRSRQPRKVEGEMVSDNRMFHAYEAGYVRARTSEVKYDDIARMAVKEWFAEWIKDGGDEFAPERAEAVGEVTEDAAQSKAYELYGTSQNRVAERVAFVNGFKWLRSRQPRKCEHDGGSIELEGGGTQCVDCLEIIKG